MGQVRHEGLRKIWLFAQPFSHRPLRDALDSCGVCRDGVTVIGLCEQRRFCDDFAGLRSLQNDGAACLAESDKMHFARKHQVQSPDGLSKVK